MGIVLLEVRLVPTLLTTLFVTGVDWYQGIRVYKVALLIVTMHRPHIIHIIKYTIHISYTIGNALHLHHFFCRTSLWERPGSPITESGETVGPMYDCILLLQALGIAHQLECAFVPGGGSGVSRCETITSYLEV